MENKYRITRYLTVLGWTYIVEQRILFFWWKDCGLKFDSKRKAQKYIDDICKK